jgi:hypothetical protein
MTSDGVYVSLRATLDEAGVHAWRRVLLEPMRDAVRSADGFNPYTAPDEDYLAAADLGAHPTVHDLLARLARAADDGELFFELAREGATMRIRSFLPSRVDYNVHGFPLVYAAVAAREAGGVASLSLLGELAGDIVIVLVNASPTALSVRRPDPQDLTEHDWNERLGGIVAFDEARARWARKAKKARRHRQME